MIVSILIAIGLNFDTFSVAIVEGSQMARVSIKNSFKVGIFFGIGQALMALLGVLLGLSFNLIISNIDHWVAFLLLSTIGIKLILESRQKENSIKHKNALRLQTLFPLVIATSIDAVAVGITLAFIHSSIIQSIITIGIITFFASFIGYYSGKELRKVFKSRVKIIGGLILISIGIKILVEHLFF